MLNPYVFLFLVLGAIGLFGSGVSIGYKWSERGHAANLAAVQNKAIDDANTAVELAIERTMASAKREADARLAARTKRHKGELDAAKKSRTECARDDESLGLLNDAIRGANGEADPAAKLPDPVRLAPAPGGWLGTIREKLGVSNDRHGGPVSETPR